jgi:hypothetical protein
MMRIHSTDSQVYVEVLEDGLRQVVYLSREDAEAAGRTLLAAARAD